MVRRYPSMHLPPGLAALLASQAVLNVVADSLMSTRDLRMPFPVKLQLQLQLQLAAVLSPRLVLSLRPPLQLPQAPQLVQLLPLLLPEVPQQLLLFLTLCPPCKVDT